MKKSPYILIDAIMEYLKMGLSGVFLSPNEGQTNKINDVCRVKDAQKSVERLLSKYRGRRVTSVDVARIEEVKRFNRIDRKKLFGSDVFVWYLV